MTVHQKNIIKRDLPTWLTLANLIILITLSYNFGASQKEIQKNIETNKADIKRHEFNNNLHMPFSKKIEVFVPRVELDSRLENMEKTLKRIEDKIN